MCYLRLELHFMELNELGGAIKARCWRGAV